METYTQVEKDFRLELSNLLNKYGASLSIEDSDVVDYKNIPNFGDLFKKTIEVSIPIPTDGGVYSPIVSFDLGEFADGKNVFTCHNKIVLPELI